VKPLVLGCQSENSQLHDPSIEGTKEEIEEGMGAHNLG
jgi:hypothetical protein